MVYLLKMVIFNGYVSHNQMVFNEIFYDVLPYQFQQGQPW